MELHNWQSKEPVNSAGHLELKYGDRIREDAEASTFEAADLRVWLRTVLKVDASEQMCQTSARGARLAA